MADLGPALATVLSQLAKLVKGLDDDAVEQLVTGETKIMLLPKGAKVELPLDANEVAQRVRGLAREEQIVSLLNADKRLGAPQLKLVAEALNLAIPSAARSKAAIQLYIAQNVAAHRVRAYG